MPTSWPKLVAGASAGFLAVYLMLCGIVSFIPKREVAPPTPDAVVVDVQAAASESLRDYGNALAETHEETAKRADEFKGYQEALDDTAKRNDAARKKAFSKIGSAMDAALPGEGTYDPAKLRSEFLKAAKGFKQ